MEDLPTTSSDLREGEEVGDQATDECSPRVQVRKIPQPSRFSKRVCTKPLSGLSRTTVDQLRVNKKSRGSYLLLRTLEPTVTGSFNNSFGRNVVVQVEDHFKNSILCCLYGYVHLRSETELKEFLPVNTVFALKEPHLITCSEQQFAVVVGSPTDFVVVGLSHVLSNDAEALGWREKEEDEGLKLTSKWCRIADGLFENKKLYDAVDAYLFALKNCTENCIDILLNQNLAKTFLALECYESTVKHALNVLEVEPSNEMALYCAGRAHYELREYRTARFYFETLNDVFPSNKNLHQLVCCTERLREAEGNVDIFKLYRASLTDVTVPIDHGSFWRNIEFRPGPGDVRGVFATQDMEPGTLILVEKAVVTFFEPTRSSEHGVFNFIRTAFTAVFKNPKTFAQKFSYLPGGCTTTDESQSLFCDEVNELEPIVYVRRLYQILLRNMFLLNNCMVENPPFMYYVLEQGSRFRHRCLSNCSSVAYKDVFVVRTSASVLKGEELFLCLFGNNLSFHEKQKGFKLRGFTCSCSLCALDKTESPEDHDLRQELKTKFDAQMALSTGVNLSAEEIVLPIVNELELSYRTRDKLRVLMLIVYHDLAKLVAVNNRSSEDWKEKVTLYVERGLQSVGLSTDSLLACVGEVVNPQIRDFALMPVIFYDFAGLMAEKEYFSGRADLAEKWVKVILLLERINRGGNLEMMKQSFRKYKVVPSLLSLFD